MEVQSGIGNEELAPSQKIYQEVIEICSGTTNVSDQPKALEIAFSCFNGMIRREIHPNARTYRFLLLSVANLLSESDQRDEIALKVFTSACQSKEVNSLVISSLEKASKKTFENYKSKPERFINSSDDVKPDGANFLCTT